MTVTHKVPQRIVSLAPSNTEILFALGLAERVIAVTSYCDYPPEARAKPQVGSWVKINDDLIAQYQPDLVLTSTIVQGGAEARYRERGLTVMHYDPTTLAMVYDSILDIGRVAGVLDCAQELVAQMQHNIRQISEQMAECSSKPRIYIEEWHKPPMMSGNWVPDLVAAAGGQYGILHAGEYSRAVDTAEVLAYDPEVIVLSLCGLALRANTDIIYKRDEWRELSAVRNRRVYVTDDSFFNRPGPRLVEGVRWLSGIIRGD